MLHACHRFGNSRKPCTFCLLLTRCTIPCACHAKTASERPKVLRTRQFFALLTSKCALRHNGIHFFDMPTSKKVVHAWCALYILTWKRASRHSGAHFFDISTPSPSVFNTFDFEMCFAPQRRALFRHLNSTSKSAPNVSCFKFFHLQMCFAPQRRALSHPSPGHMALHPPLYRAYFSTLWSHKSLEKHSESWLFYLLRTCVFCFSPLIFFFSSHLCFSSVHMVESSTSKLPSMITEP